MHVLHKNCLIIFFNFHFRNKIFYYIDTKFLSVFFEKKMAELSLEKKLMNKLYNEGTGLCQKYWPKNQSLAFLSKLCHLYYVLNPSRSPLD